MWLGRNPVCDSDSCQGAVLHSAYLIIVRKDVEGQWLFTAVDELYGLVGILHRHDGKNGPENFFLHHPGFRIDVSKDRWGWKRKAARGNGEVEDRNAKLSTFFFVC